MDQRQRYRALYRAVHQTLLHDWDPIGIKHVPQCRDEYDAYIPALVRLLTHGSPVEELAAYLSDVATVTMGLPEQSDRDRAVARHLRTAYEHVTRA